MPKDMSSVRYSRLLKVIALLQSRKQVSRSELEAVGEYPVKETSGYYQNRTLQNDLDFLRDLGAVITYDRRRKLYILDEEGSLIVNIKITKGEVEALSAGLKMVSHFLPHLEENSKTLWEKLGTYIPQDFFERGEDLAKSTVMAIPVAPVKAEVFNTLLEAKHKKQAIEITYKSPDKPSRQWILSPYDFYFRGNAWYMISFNHKHKALSIHRMSRITRAIISEEKYVEAEEGGFTGDYISTAWHIAPGPEKHFVKIQLFENLADSMSEIRWHPTQKIEKIDKKSIILTAEVPHLEEVARWVLSGAPNAKVIEPEELKEIVRKFAQSAISEPSE